MLFNFESLHYFIDNDDNDDDDGDDKSIYIALSANTDAL